MTRRLPILRFAFKTSCAYQGKVMPWLFAPPPISLGVPWETARGFIMAMWPHVLTARPTAR
jgi:hypothetical protein